MKRKTKKVNKKKKKVSKRKTKSFLVKSVERLDEELNKIGRKTKKTLKINPSTGPLAMPRNVEDAFAWGYVKGVERGLDACGLTDFIERRNLRKKIAEIKLRWEETADIELESQLMGSTRSRMPSVEEGRGFGRRG